MWLTVSAAIVFCHAVDTCCTGSDADLTRHLDLSNDGLMGAVPAGFFTLTAINDLLLNGNRFTGTVLRMPHFTRGVTVGREFRFFLSACCRVTVVLPCYYQARCRRRCPL